MPWFLIGVGSFKVATYDSRSDEKTNKLIDHADIEYRLLLFSGRIFVFSLPFFSSSTYCGTKVLLSVVSDSIISGSVKE